MGLTFILLQILFLLSFLYLVVAVDYVVVAFDEPAKPFLNRLSDCITANDQVFIYLKQGSRRTHSKDYKQNIRDNDIKKQFQWETISVKFNVTVIPQQNLNDEFLPFMSYITAQYKSLPSLIAFLHGHVKAWHSRDVCDITKKGIKTIMKSKHGIQNINEYYARRCMSEKGIQGPVINKGVRDRVYNNWKNWTTDDEVPKRIVWDCCTQSIVKREALLSRSFQSWNSLLQVANKSHAEKLHFEYIWPTLVDPGWAAASAKC